MNYLLKNKKYKSSRGFSLFLAVITIGILLILAFSMSSISSKQSAFSNINKESVEALFAADAGVECALYWDAKNPPNPDISAFDRTVSGSPINCGGVSIANGQTIPTGYAQATTSTTVLGGGQKSVFGFSLNSNTNPSNACVLVIVNKNVSGSTKINSYGYNTCDTSDPRRVERGVEVNY